MSKLRAWPWYVIAIIVISVSSIIYMIFGVSIDYKANMIMGALYFENILVMLFGDSESDSFLLNIASIIGGAFTAGFITSFALYFVKTVCGFINRDNVEEYEDATWVSFVLTPFDCVMAILSGGVWNKIFIKLSEFDFVEFTNVLYGDVVDITDFLVIAFIIYTLCWAVRGILPVIWGVFLFFAKSLISLIITLVIAFISINALENVDTLKFEYLITENTLLVILIMLFFLSDVLISVWSANSVGLLGIISDASEFNSSIIKVSVLRYINGLLWCTVIGGLLFGGFMNYLIKLQSESGGAGIETGDILNYFAPKVLLKNLKLSLKMGAIKILAFVPPVLLTVFCIMVGKMNPAVIVVMGFISLLPGFYLRVVYSNVEYCDVSGTSFRDSREHALNGSRFINRAIIMGIHRLIGLDIVNTVSSVFHVWWYEKYHKTTKKLI